MKTRNNLVTILSVGLLTLAIIPCGCRKKNSTPGTEPGSNKYAWAVGARDSTNYGTILFTRNGGDTWERQGEGSAALQDIDLLDVWAVDSNTVWAVGSNNTILKTMDGGKNWTRVPAPLNRSDVLLLSVSLAGNDNVWISGIPGIVYNSKDDGSTWTVFDTNFFRHGIMQGIHAVNPQTVYVAGGVGTATVKGFIARTLDGGLTWDSIVPANNYNRHEWISVKSFGPDHIVVYGVKSHYVCSHDGGATWRNDSVPGTGGTGGADINCLTILDDQTWWGAFDYDGIFLTRNGGISWTKQQSAGPGGMWLFGIDFYSKDHALIVAQNSYPMMGKILKTTDAGNLWQLKYFCKAWLNKVSCAKN
jgi:photosystem II stability/assembly factor-like uncharacterized protein